MTTNLNQSDYLYFSQCNPDLRYNFDGSTVLGRSKAGTLQIIESYFQSQPAPYRRELEAFSKLNGGDSPGAKPPECWVFVPCFNEDRNLKRIVSLFDRQALTFGRPFELCFILNCPDSNAYRERLYRSINILLEAKRDRPSIHIVPKIFSPKTASLGRARKYGFDYCLERIRATRPADVDKTFIVCTEGDTLELPDNYLRDYAAHFKDPCCKLVQGRIEYPRHLLERSEALHLFTSVREAVHKGQGKHRADFPEFGGLMPCGRNFALSPALYARVGGVDAVRRPGPEDDIIFGSDIVRLIGEKAKELSNVSLITSPRREVLIIRDMIRGEDTNLKRAYEDFHNATEIRDFETSDIERVVFEEFPQSVSPKFIPTLLSQLYQWVVSSKLKGAVASHLEAQMIKEAYTTHQVGYWEKENMLWQCGQRWLAAMPQEIRSRYENKIADDALYWFQHFNRQHDMTFLRSNNGILSRLAEPVCHRTRQAYG